MQNYLNLLQEILDKGSRKSDRTGTGTLSLFGHQMRFELGRGFPAVTTKKLHLKSIIFELLWFLRGDTNISYLNDNGVTIWDEWATDEGNLGPIYGAQWRNWITSDGGHIDQLSQLLVELQTRPESRRHIVSAWNPAVLPDESRSPGENVSAGLQALPKFVPSTNTNDTLVLVLDGAEGLGSANFSLSLFDFIQESGQGDLKSVFEDSITWTPLRAFREALGSFSSCFIYVKNYEESIDWQDLSERLVEAPWLDGKLKLVKEGAELIDHLCAFDGEKIQVKVIPLGFRSLVL